jgi:hypothetical protein
LRSQGPYRSSLLTASRKGVIEVVKVWRGTGAASATATPALMCVGLLAHRPRFRIIVRVNAEEGEAGVRGDSCTVPLPLLGPD